MAVHYAVTIDCQPVIGEQAGGLYRGFCNYFPARVKLGSTRDTPHAAWQLSVSVAYAERKYTNRTKRISDYWVRLAERISDDVQPV